MVPQGANRGVGSWHMQYESRRLIVLMALVAFASSILYSQSTATVRKWSDTSGKYKVDAEFLGLKDGKVSLRKTDGNSIEVPLEKLSKADRDFVKSLEQGDPPAEKKATRSPSNTAAKRTLKKS